MAKAKTKSDATVTVNFRCTPEMKRGLEILALVARKKDLTEYMNEVCSQLIELNRATIDAVNSAAVQSPFDSSAPTQKKPAPRKKSGKTENLPADESTAPTVGGGDGV